MPLGMGHWGWGYPPPYTPYGTPYGGFWGYAPSKEQEKQALLNWQSYLQDQKQYLDEQLEEITRRLSELEKPE